MQNLYEDCSYSGKGIIMGINAQIIGLFDGLADGAQTEIITLVTQIIDFFADFFSDFMLQISNALNL